MVYGWFEDMALGKTATFREYLVEADEMVAFSEKWDPFPFHVDRDFLIFDFILLGTVLLAGVGVANAMLIQVRARDREFAVLKSIGISRGQVARMLLIEGTIIGCVSAVLAIVIGNGLGAISIRFLDHFTLFDYFLRISVNATPYISALCVFTCIAASIYPAFVADRTSSAESLHFE